MARVAENINNGKKENQWLERFINDLQIPGCVVQIGALNWVFGNLTLENYPSILKELEGENVYFLGGVNPAKNSRAEDDDVLQKNYWFVDFDIRNYHKKEYGEEISDIEIKEIAVGFIHSFAQDLILSQWRYLKFTGNGVHFHYSGLTVPVISKEHWKYGMRCILRKAEDLAKMTPDMGCTNVGRISRMPGSYNWKNDRCVWVEIMEFQDKHVDIGQIEKMGEEELKRVKEETRKRSEEIKTLHTDTGDAYTAIQSIPIDSLICRELGVEVRKGRDGKKNFHDPAPEAGEARIRGYWVPPGENHVIHGGTSAFSAEHDGYSPFEFIKMLHGLTNAETFAWYKEQFPEIAEISKKEWEDEKEAAEEQEPHPVTVLQDIAPAPTLPILPDSAFAELRGADVVDVLGSTVKKDDANKLLTFLTLLTTYTNDSQFNLLFQAPSSSGKSYIPLEIAQYFPQADIRKLGYSSPQAFFHEQGKPIYFKQPVLKGKKKKWPPPDAYLVNLERTIIIFVDQPHGQVLERLRPILSHDEKRITIQITDKQKGGGQRTKKIILQGYPVVVFCTTCLSFDEQEVTRFLMLSPETTQEKIREGILTAIHRSSDRDAYQRALAADPARQLLQQRVLAVRDAEIGDVIIRASESQMVEDLFLAEGKALKPRHQRDAPRFMNIMKAFALLNFMHRERIEKRIVATVADFEETKVLWAQINESQEHNLSPYFLSLYKEILLTTYEKANDGKIGSSRMGITKKDILKQHHAIYQRPLSDAKLRQEILPALETAGLVEMEKDREDKRVQRITPLLTEGEIVRRGGEETPMESSYLPF